MARHPVQQLLALTAGPQFGGLRGVKGERRLEIVAAGRQPREAQHGRVMRRQRRNLEGPFLQVAIQERHHGRAPDVAEPAFGEGRAQADVFVARPQMPVGFAVGKVRPEDQLQRHPAHVGIHSGLVGGQVAWGPLPGEAAFERLHHAQPLRLQRHPGIEHRDLPPLVEQCLRAGDPSRPGPDHVAQVRVGRIGSRSFSAFSFLNGGGQVWHDCSADYGSAAVRQSKSVPKSAPGAARAVHRRVHCCGDRRNLGLRARPQGCAGFGGPKCWAKKSSTCFMVSALLKRAPPCLPPLTTT